MVPLVSDYGRDSVRQTPPRDLMLGDVHTGDTLEPGPVVGADPGGGKKAELRADAQHGILARLEFVVKQPALPLGTLGGTHERPRRLLLCIAAAPLSPQHPRWQGASWATSSTDHARSSARAGVEKATYLYGGTLSFLLRQAAVRQVPVKGQATNGQNVQTLCHQDHAT